MLIAVLLLTGMGLALLGSIKLPLAARLQIDEARVGGLVSLFAFVMSPMILAAGFLTDLLSEQKQTVLMSGSVFYAVSLGLLAVAKTYPQVLLAVMAFSGGWALLANMVNVLTPLVFAEGNIDNMPYATNLGNVFFGLGAFLTPLGVMFLVRRTSLTTTLILLGGLALLPAGLALGVDFATLSSPTPSGAAGLRSLLTDRVMWLCGMALFFYGPLEASMAAWATTYLRDQGVREGTAAGLLSGFWLTFVAARLVTAFTLPSGREANLILALGLLCVVVLLGMVFSRGPTLAMGLVLAAGFVFGPIFPTILAILLGHVTPATHGRAVGLLFAISGVGWTVIPMLIGAYARRTSVQRSFSLAVVTAVGLCAVALMLAFR
jgi:fucose permease